MSLRGKTIVGYIQICNMIAKPAIARVYIVKHVNEISTVTDLDEAL